MKAIEFSGSIIVVSDIPIRCENTHRYNLLPPETHYADGWRDVIEPTISDTQKTGEIFFDSENDYFTYPVIEKSYAEIQSEKLEVLASEKEQKIYEIQRGEVLAPIQGYEGTKALENAVLYPLWEADIDVKVGEKYLDFDSENELQLYRVEQAHTTQDGWPGIYGWEVYDE